MSSSEADDAVSVRAMRRDDMPAVHRMIHELAAFEGMPRGPQLSVRDLIEDGFESSPSWFFGLVAERRGAVAGYALCSRAYSSWTRRAFYVEDLYVAPEQRARGVGGALMRELCQMALAAGVHRVDWHVLADNAGALRFYARLGARDLAASEGRAALRLDRERIEAVARGALLPAP
ncbi:thialysine N-epsilon-acetyltransferase-like [Bicyclus anynana]|uniref:Thialysine N-epsilon-acetyltransferase-like n=1 Tax=Bicyclus anynana TaxID=110368 RepID=A0A6J1N7D3_BICAN|nr:thialysine N-epsilon-acetyltransferase-like [Bicyclus anynana]XP_023943651.2 thialysine N-epsilon-acetyltransferase-like [Bicyclus anynana]